MKVTVDRTNGDSLSQGGGAPNVPFSGKLDFAACSSFLLDVAVNDVYAVGETMGKITDHIPTCPGWTGTLPVNAQQRATEIEHFRELVQKRAGGKLTEPELCLATQARFLWFVQTTMPRLEYPHLGKEGNDRGDGGAQAGNDRSKAWLACYRVSKNAITRKTLADNKNGAPITLSLPDVPFERAEDAGVSSQFRPFPRNHLDYFFGCFNPAAIASDPSQTNPKSRKPISTFVDEKLHALISLNEGDFLVRRKFVVHDGTQELRCHGPLMDPRFVLQLILNKKQGREFIEKILPTAISRNPDIDKALKSKIAKKLKQKEASHTAKKLKREVSSKADGDDKSPPDVIDVDKDDDTNKLQSVQKDATEPKETKKKKKKQKKTKKQAEMEKTKEEEAEKEKKTKTKTKKKTATKKGENEQKASAAATSMTLDGKQTYSYENQNWTDQWKKEVAMQMIRTTLSKEKDDDEGELRRLVDWGAEYDSFARALCAMERDGCFLEFAVTPEGCTAPEMQKEKSYEITGPCAQMAQACWQVNPHAADKAAREGRILTLKDIASETRLNPTDPKISASSGSASTEREVQLRTTLSKRIFCIAQLTHKLRAAETEEARRADRVVGWGESMLSERFDPNDDADLPLAWLRSLRELVSNLSCAALVRFEFREMPAASLLGDRRFVCPLEGKRLKPGDPVLLVVIFTHTREQYADHSVFAFGDVFQSDVKKQTREIVVPRGSRYTWEPGFAKDCIKVHVCSA